MSIVFSHYSVLLQECIDGLDIKPDGVYVDLTTGGAGHSYEIVKRLTNGGKHIAIDRDDDALMAAKQRLKEFSDRVIFVNGIRKKHFKRNSQITICRNAFFIPCFRMC